ncbi:MAG: polyprenyl synthetase family protein [Akkermansiaceae bacterium]|nr:polyprenyl synthetase family protein [Armatimonadota bacterium]
MSSEKDPFEDLRALAGRCVEQWVPRRCSDEWLRTVSGESRFVWDREALRVGFHDPFYRCFDARPERLRPVLAAALIAATGRDPAEHSAILAALETLYLSTLVLQGFRNGHSLGEAAPCEDANPLSVMATAAYNAAQFAPTLVSRHADTLDRNHRAWLTYRFGQALMRRAAGTAEQLAHWEQRRCFLDENAYVLYLAQYVTPLTFVLSVDCLIAVCGGDVPEAAALRTAAVHTGIAYQLTVEWEERLRVKESTIAHPVPLEPSYFFAGPDSEVGDLDEPGGTATITRDTAARFAGLAAAHRDLAEEAIASLSQTLGDVFTRFGVGLMAFSFLPAADDKGEDEDA